jgi:hypothetical protein
VSFSTSNIENTVNLENANVAVRELIANAVKTKRNQSLRELEEKRE